MQPPAEIDGARVLFWAWSGETPFFVMNTQEGISGVEIFGLAVCRYQNTGEVYRLSCNQEWGSENDSYWGASVETALCGEFGNYDITKIKWLSSEGSA